MITTHFEKLLSYAEGWENKIACALARQHESQIYFPSPKDRHLFDFVLYSTSQHYLTKYEIKSSDKSKIAVEFLIYHKDGKTTPGSFSTTQCNRWIWNDTKEEKIYILKWEPFRHYILEKKTAGTLDYVDYRLKQKDWVLRNDSRPCSLGFVEKLEVASKSWCKVMTYKELNFNYDKENN